MTTKIYVCYTSCFCGECGGIRENKIAFKHEIQAKEWVGAKNQIIADYKKFTDDNPHVRYSEFPVKFKDLDFADGGDYDEIELVS